MSFGSGPLGDLLGKLGSSEIAGKLLQTLGPAVVQGVLDQLNRQGLGPKVNSWLGRGANEPITAEELRAALGNAKVQEMAKSLGLPADRLAEVLAQALPAAAEQAAQDGAVHPPS